MTRVPPRLDDEFLGWLKAETESAWRDAPPPGPATLGPAWQAGTRWVEPLSDAEIDALERRRRRPFPPEHRLFLRRLHATDRPRRGWRYEGARRVALEAPGFWDWRRDARALRGALARVRAGIVFDVERNALWPRAWGPRPASRAGARVRVRARMDEAPRLIPLLGHRFLLETPVDGRRPALSIVQTDVVVYGADLRSYLLAELAGLLGLGPDQLRRECPPAPALSRIRFWGDWAEEQPPPTKK